MSKNGLIPRARPVMIDLITINAIILTIILFMYAATWGTSLSLNFIFACVLIALGLAVSLLIGLVKLGGLSTLKYRNRMMLWLFICLGVVYILNWSTTWKSGASLSLDYMSSTVLIGVAEDVFFRSFITAWLIALTGPFLGIILGSGVFTVYHTNRYGSDPNSMMITFGAGLVLGWAMHSTGSLTSSVLAHVIVNFAALGGFLYGGPVASLVVTALISVLLLYLIAKPKRGGS